MLVRIIPERPKGANGGNEFLLPCFHVKTENNTGITCGNNQAGADGFLPHSFGWAQKPVMFSMIFCVFT
jgi:hypothetical protein